MEEVAALPDGTPYLPIAKQIAAMAKLQPGKKVQVTMTDEKYIMVKVA